MLVRDRRDVVVIKIGGSVSVEADAAFAAITSLHDGGHQVVVVHGGGPLVGEWTKRFGLETRFIRGLRVTDEATRDTALAVLAGLSNKRIVAALLARGVAAAGISGIDGGTLRAAREEPSIGLVGRIELVDSSLIEDLLDAGHVPVVAPAAIDASDGELLNVNADAAAGAIAASLPARLLALVTDVPGVRSADGTTIARLDATAASVLIADGTIEGGMLPKVEACLLASGAGSRAAILSARGVEAIERLLAGEAVGTVFDA